MKKWPKDTEIKKILFELEENPELYSLATSENSTQTDRIKRDICAELIIYKRQHSLNQRELAQKLEISEALVSKVLRYRFEEFTLDRLIRYLEKLDIKYEFRKIA